MDLETELFVIVAAVLNEKRSELDQLLQVTVSIYNELSVTKLDSIELKEFLKKLIQTRTALYTFEINEQFYEIESTGFVYGIIQVSTKNQVILLLSKHIINEINRAKDLVQDQSAIWNSQKSKNVLSDKNEALNQATNLNNESTITPKKSIYAFSSDSTSKKKRSKGNVDLTLFIKTLAAFISTLPSMKAESSICGKQVQQLFIEWAKINEDVPSIVPQRMFSSLPNEQKVIITDVLYILKTKAHKNGEYTMELSEPEGNTNTTNDSILIPEELSDLAIDFGDKVEETAKSERPKSEIRFLIPLIATLVYFGHEMKQKSSLIGSDMRELYPRWKALNPSLPHEIPIKVFSSMPQNCSIEISNKIYNLQTQGNGKGEYFMELLELLDFNKESEIIIVDPILLDFFESDDDDEDLPDDQHIMNTKIPTVSAVISKDLSKLYKEKIEYKLLTNTRNEIIKRIQNKIVALDYPSCVVEIFGSTASNLAYKNSDLDITVTSTFPNHPLTNMRKMANMLRKLGFQQVIPICNARVPICKFYDKDLRINCDINFGHSLGVYNSGLIRSYTMLDPRVKPLILLVKLWAKNRDINNPSSGDTISSYAYCLMVIAYLQHVGVVKNLQDQRLGFEKRLVKVPETKVRHGKNVQVEMREVDISYCYDFKTGGLKDSIRDSSKFLDSKLLWNGNDGVPALFLGFCQFFCSEYKYSKKWCVSVKDGGFLKGVDFEVNSRLVVLDPFEKERNCTGMVKKTLGLIQDEFKRLVDMVENGEVRRVFDSLSRAPTNDPSQKRFFKRR